MNLADIVKLECCEIDFRATDKNDALTNLAALLKRSRELRNIDQKTIYDALKAREDIGSTGFSKGIAIPHCQLEGIRNFIISIAICKKGVNYDSLDNKKTRIFVTIIGPAGAKSDHLKLLAATSHVLKEPDVIDNLLHTSTKIALYEEFLRNSENNIKKAVKKGNEKLIIMIVKDDNIMQDITETFVEYGIEESTIIETQQMENLLSKVPLFLGFFNFTGDKNPHSKLVLVKIPKDHINAVIKGLEDIFGDLDSFSGLSLMVLDLFMSKGF